MPRAAAEKSKPRKVAIPSDVRLAKPVHAYLSKHRKLAQLLPAICRRMREEFGPRAELVLDVNRDPEFEDPYLKLVVRLACYERTMASRIDSIWNKFEKDLCDIPGWLLITTDYRVLDGSIRSLVPPQQNAAEEA